MSAWKWIGSSSFSLSQAMFGDFNGDGITDILRVSGDRGYASFGLRDSSGGYAGHSGWKYVIQFAYGSSSIRLGDFNGDGRTDFLAVGPAAWNVAYCDSSGQAPSWSTRNRSAPSSTIRASHLLIGDFTGDGRDDIVRVVPNP